MLCELKVKNLALIESLHLQFEGNSAAGLVVMTGETGAGKSIMLRAISMITGVRAQTDWIRNGAEECSVEALFEISPDHSEFLAQLDESGFGDETTVIIKRIVSANGRSRIYVNGSLATAKIVSELSHFLLNIASQHDHQQLLQPHKHLDILDILGNYDKEKNRFGDLYRKWREVRARLDELVQQEKEKGQRKDFLEYQVGEIRQINPVVGEDEQLDQEKRRLKSSDTLIKLSQECYSAFSTNIWEELGQVKKKMEQAAGLDETVLRLSEELSNMFFQAEDMAIQLREYRDSIETDPYRLEQVTERIDQIQGLKRKYGDSIEDILSFAREGEEELQRLESLEIELETLQKEVGRLGRELVDAASCLRRRRKETAEFFSKAMAAELVSLNFGQAGIEVRWQETEETLEEIGPNGWDKVEFFFSANPGEPTRPLSKVASGGELSRVMLALKCLLAKRDMVETVIFDEVDAGIGGEAAEAVARKIKELASHHQVFCITHLPQIAARGDEHYRVEKSVNGGRTTSSVIPLDGKAREHEIARMLAGVSAGEEAFAWARELLKKSGSL